MLLTGQEFSYENYRLIKDIAVFDILVADLPSVNPDFKRYIPILENSGSHMTSEMTTTYLSCELGTARSLGKKFFGLIKNFLNNKKNTK